MNLVDSTMFLFFIFFTLFEMVFSGRNFYKILGVPRAASIDEIKSAYRKNARLYHPDRNSAPDAQEMFRDLSDAYKVLSDRKKRSIYDQSEGIKSMENGGGFGGHDPFASFFGDFFGGGSHDQEEDTPRGADVIIDLFATLEEVYSGKFVEVKRKKSVYKQTSGTRECNCRHEMRTQQLGAGRFQMFQVRVCDQCPAVELITTTKTLEVEIEMGSDNGNEIRFMGEGEPHIEGEPGDLIFKIRIEPHKIFERSGLDLYTNVTISLQQALSGFELDITHLDGHKVHIVRDKVTWPGARIRKKDEGMTSSTDNKLKGILYVTFDIDFPRGELTLEQKSILSDLLKQNLYTPKIYNGLQGY